MGIVPTAEVTRFQSAEQHVYIRLVKRVTIPRATVARLPLYLQCLEGLDEGTTTISSDQLATIANANSAKVRKDLSYLGSNGVRGVGYDRAALIGMIRRELGLTEDWPIVIIGAGNLGSALANYGGFAKSGFRLVAVYDVSAARVGSQMDGMTVRSLDHLEADVAEHTVAIGVITTPAKAAQEVVDRLVGAGVRSILNFAPTIVQAPPEVDVRHVDLSTELQILSFYRARKP